jgi:acyl-CoA thioesterase
MPVVEEDLRFAREVVGNDPLAVFLGIQVAELEEGRAVVTLQPRPEHLNALDRVHGSTLYALADQAAAVAANAVGRPALIVEGKVNFLRAAPPHRLLRAEARAIDRGRRLSLWEVHITAGGELVATAQVMAYHRRT